MYIFCGANLKSFFCCQLYKAHSLTVRANVTHCVVFQRAGGLCIAPWSPTASLTTQWAAACLTQACGCHLTVTRPSPRSCSFRWCSTPSGCSRRAASTGAPSAAEMPFTCWAWSPVGPFWCGTARTTSTSSRSALRPIRAPRICG